MFVELLSLTFGPSSFRCVFCGEYVGHWAAGDGAMSEHSSLFPHCPFVRGLDVGNVPIVAEDDEDLDLAEDGRPQTEAAAAEAGADEETSGDETGIRYRTHLGSGPEKGGKENE